MMKLMTNSGNSSTALDSYFELSRKGTDYRRQVAMEVWSSLTPAEKRAYQDASRKLAGNNLRFGAEHTQALLLLKFAEAESAKGATQTAPLHSWV